MSEKAARAVAMHALDQVAPIKARMFQPHIVFHVHPDDIRLMAEHLMVPSASPPFDNALLHGYPVVEDHTVEPGSPRAVIEGRA